MTTAHTEAPWDVMECGNANEYHVVAGDRWLMTIQHNGEQLVEKQRANLRVVKTAPRLLVALQECHELLAAICEVCCDNPPPGGIDRLENARRAIAEATGTQEWGEGG